LRIIVLDTSVFVSACLSTGGASREVLRLCLNRKCLPLMGEALYMEYEAVLSRERLFGTCVLDPGERTALFEAFLSVCRWTRVYYSWRPNVPDESDNHVVELAVAGGATAIVTRNIRDFGRMELRFGGLMVMEPATLLKGERNGNADDQGA
jgi:putative PIN family toxin of toxin-antitoxin system